MDDGTSFRVGWECRYPPTPDRSVHRDPVTGNAPLGVTFTDSSTGTSLTNWRWDFGDGNITNYAVRTHPYHIYTSAGLKSINLTVTGTGGTDSEVKTGYISVTTPPVPPTAAFSGTPVTGYAPLGVTFTDSSTGTSLTNWRWDFGDGNITNYAVRTHPYHIYYQRRSEKYQPDGYRDRRDRQRNKDGIYQCHHTPCSPDCGVQRDPGYRLCTPWRNVY